MCFSVGPPDVRAENVQSAGWKFLVEEHRRSVIEAKEAIAYPVFGHAVELWGKLRQRFDWNIRKILLIISRGSRGNLVNVPPPNTNFLELRELESIVKHFKISLNFS